MLPSSTFFITVFTCRETASRRGLCVCRKLRRHWMILQTQRLRVSLFGFAALSSGMLFFLNYFSFRKATEISEHCGIFLEGRHSPLFPLWITDRAKLLSKGKRTERPDMEIRHLEQAVKKIERNKPHSISQGRRSSCLLVE